MVDYLRDENFYRLTQGQISLAVVSQLRFSNHREIDILTIWTTEGARMSRQDFTSYVGIGSRVHEALDDALIILY